MFTDPIKFHLVREREIGDLKGDFEKIVSYLGTYGDIGLQRSGDGFLTITYPETQAVSTLETSVDPGATDVVTSRQITLTCERKDNFTVNLLKNITGRIGYRIYNPQNSSYLVADPTLLDLTTINIDPKLITIFKAYGLMPLYNYNNSKVYYAKSLKDDSIHLVNTHMLDHALSDKLKNIKQPDFSVRVAKSVGEFIALADRGLISIDFYKRYFSKSKIVNLSGFNAKKLQVSIYIMPVFLELDKAQQRFYQLSETKFPGGLRPLQKGSSVFKESQKLLKRFSKNKKIIAVKVGRAVSYHKGENGNLTPILKVSIFVTK